VHPSAVVDDGAQIGEGTKIWHFAHVMSGAVIGRDCVIGQGCFIGNVTIGNGARIQNNVSVYDGVTLEDNVFAGPSCVFTNVMNPRSEVDRKSEYQPTLIKKGATIGANATIICGLTIGEYAFVGAGALGLAIGRRLRSPGRLTSFDLARQPVRSPRGSRRCRGCRSSSSRRAGSGPCPSGR